MGMPGPSGAVMYLMVGPVDGVVKTRMRYRRGEAAEPDWASSMVKATEDVIVGEVNGMGRDGM